MKTHVTNNRELKEAKTRNDSDKTDRSTPANNLERENSFTQNLANSSQQVSQSLQFQKTADNGLLDNAGQDLSVQLKGPGTSLHPGEIQSYAQQGVQGEGGKLPHFDKIQESFGQHDISHIQAYTGRSASEASTKIGAKAYATGNKIAFASDKPDLHTAAHEAAHTLQQQAGVNLYGGVGRENDQYERQADTIADKVVKGQSAEAELNTITTPGKQQNSLSHSNPVQRKIGFEAELILPVSSNKVLSDDGSLEQKSIKEASKYSENNAPTEDIKTFLYGGMIGKESISDYQSNGEYGTSFRIEADHINFINKPWRAIHRALIKLGYIKFNSKYDVASEDTDIIGDMEYVTKEMDENDIGANAKFEELGRTIAEHADKVKNNAKNGSMGSVPGGHKHMRVGVPENDFKKWLGEDYQHIEKHVNEINKLIEHSRFYMQATVGIFPSAFTKNFQNYNKSLLKKMKKTVIEKEKGDEKDNDDEKEQEKNIIRDKKNAKERRTIYKSLDTFVQEKSINIANKYWKVFNESANTKSTHVKNTYRGLISIVFSSYVAQSKIALDMSLAQDKNRFTFLPQAAYESLNDPAGIGKHNEQNPNKKDKKKKHIRVQNSQVLSNEFLTWVKTIPLKAFSSAASEMKKALQQYEKDVRNDKKLKKLLSDPDEKKEEEKKLRALDGELSDVLRIAFGHARNINNAAILRTGAIRPDKLVTSADKRNDDQKEEMLAFELRHILEFPNSQSISGLMDVIVNHVRNSNLSVLDTNTLMQIQKQIKQKPLKPSKKKTSELKDDNDTDNDIGNIDDKEKLLIEAAKMASLIEASNSSAQNENDSKSEANNVPTVSNGDSIRFNANGKTLDGQIIEVASSYCIASLSGRYTYKKRLNFSKFVQNFDSSISGQWGF